MCSQTWISIILTLRLSQSDGEKCSECVSWPIRNHMLWDRWLHKERWVPVGPDVDHLGLKIWEHGYPGISSCYSGTLGWGVLYDSVFLDFVLVIFFEATLVGLLRRASTVTPVLDHTEHHQDDEIQGMRKCVNHLSLEVVHCRNWKHVSSFSTVSPSSTEILNVSIGVLSRKGQPPVLEASTTNLSHNKWNLGYVRNSFEVVVHACVLFRFTAWDVYL